MFETLSHKIAKNLILKKLVTEFVQAFYSVKSDLGSGSMAWEQMMANLAQQPGGSQERDEEILNQYTQDVQNSPTALTAGKFVAFNYTSANGDNKSYFVMIVGAFGGRGTYSNRNTKNELLSCFLIDSGTNLNTLSILGNILSEQVDPRAKSYQFLSDMSSSRVLFKKNNKRGLSRAGLNTLFPKNKFRTFKLNIGMENIYEIETNG